MFLGFSLLVHFLVIFFYHNNIFKLAQHSPSKKSPLIVTIGEKNTKNKRKSFFEPQKTPPAIKPAPLAKSLSLSDLAEPSQASSSNPAQNPSRPGRIAPRAKALSRLRYGADDFKKLAKDSMLQGGADILTSQKFALNFEIPEGKKEDELNESQLKLYSFFRRGAMKYVASISSEIKEFELKNPHLQTPLALVDTKQVLTGRLVYDNLGNLKQIKMVRWSNNDKLQGFFENVLKRLDTLQNPPKELWAETGEFTIFVTLQING